MTHTILLTFAALSVGDAFYPQDQPAFTFVKESERKYSTTYNGKREVFMVKPEELEEPVEAIFEV